MTIESQSSEKYQVIMRGTKPKPSLDETKQVQVSEPVRHVTHKAASHPAHPPAPCTPPARAWPCQTRKRASWP